MTRMTTRYLGLCLFALGGCVVDKVKLPDGQGGGTNSVSTDDAGREASVGEGGASGGEGGTSACGAPCNKADASFCDPESKQCVRCQNSSQCAGLPATPACLATVGCVECTADNADKCSEGKVCSNSGKSTNTCVACNSPADCGDDNPVCSDHVCKPCSGGAEDCQGRTSGNSVCDMTSGACVQCTKDERRACAVDNDGKRDVCNAETLTCQVGVKEGSAPLCGAIQPKECVSNDECPAGSTCVQEFLDTKTFNSWYCMPKKGSALCKRPFAGEKTKPTRDDVDATVCTLRVSTCSALSQYSSTNCEGSDGKGDNSKCGVEGVDDGYCVDGGAVLGFRCSVPCTSLDGVDCPDNIGVTCANQPHGDQTRSRNLCTL